MWYPRAEEKYLKKDKLGRGSDHTRSAHWTAAGLAGKELIWVPGKQPATSRVKLGEKGISNCWCGHAVDSRKLVGPGYLQMAQPMRILISLWRGLWKGYHQTEAGRSQRDHILDPWFGLCQLFSHVLLISSLFLLQCSCSSLYWERLSCLL